MKRMLMTGWMILAMSMTVNARAALLFIDTFENGNVTNSDSVIGFWTKITSSGTLSELDGQIVLQDKPKTNANVSATASSPIVTDFNFFTTTLVYNVKFNLAMTNIAAADKSKMDFRFFVNDGAGQNLTQSTNYFAITQFGSGNVTVRSKVNGGTATGITITNTVSAQELTLRLDAANYYLDMIYAGGVTNSSTGAHGLSAATWRTTGSSLQMMAYSAISTAASTNGTWTVGVSELTVNSIPEPAAMGLFALAGITVLGIRRMVLR